MGTDRSEFKNDQDAEATLSERIKSDKPISPTLREISDFIVRTSASSDDQDRRADKMLSDLGLGRVSLSYERENLKLDDGKHLAKKDIKELLEMRGTDKLGPMEKAIMRGLDRNFDSVGDHKSYYIPSYTPHGVGHRGVENQGVSHESLKKFADAETKAKDSFEKAPSNLKPHMDSIMRNWGNARDFEKLADSNGVVTRESLAENLRLYQKDVRDEQRHFERMSKAGGLDQISYDKIQTGMKSIDALTAMSQNFDGIRQPGAPGFSLDDLKRVSAEGTKVREVVPEVKPVSNATIENTNQAVESLMDGLITGGKDLTSAVENINDYLVKKHPTGAARNLEARRIMAALQDSETDKGFLNKYVEANAKFLNGGKALDRAFFNAALAADSKNTLNPMDLAAMRALSAARQTSDGKLDVVHLKKDAEKQDVDRVEHVKAATLLKPYLGVLNYEYGKTDAFMQLSGDKRGVLTQDRLGKAIEEKKAEVARLTEAARRPGSSDRDLADKQHHQKVLEGLKELNSNFNALKRSAGRGLTEMDLQKASLLLDYRTRTKEWDKSPAGLAEAKALATKKQTENEMKVKVVPPVKEASPDKLTKPLVLPKEQVPNWTPSRVSGHLESIGGKKSPDTLSNWLTPMNKDLSLMGIKDSNLQNTSTLGAMNLTQPGGKMFELQPLKRPAPAAEEAPRRQPSTHGDNQVPAKQPAQSVKESIIKAPSKEVDQTPVAPKVEPKYDGPMLTASNGKRYPAIGPNGERNFYLDKNGVQHWTKTSKCG